jgi:DNA-binding MarR family transcriptional regulator/GNAT superfamily N-acetyltransferase
MKTDMSATATSPGRLKDEIGAFRRFNRLYTRFIGTLDEGHLKTEYSLPEARVLYELATRTMPNAKEIAESLGMDPGYLSRLLGKFERAALLKRKASAEDNRIAELRLTARGRSAFAKLNALSDAQARTILRQLPLSNRSRLIRSMLAIEDVLTEAGQRRAPYILRPHRIGDLGWVVARESAVYAEEYGWDEAFEAFIARLVADFITNFDAKRERCWIADVGGESMGHVFLMKHPEQPHTAKLRLLFVEPSARSLGLGHALVDECIRFARTAGYRKISLWTQSILLAAHRIYQQAGFQLIREEPHHSFGHDLIGQTWELDLQPRSLS